MKDDIYEHIAEYLALKQTGAVPNELEEKVKAWQMSSEENRFEFEKLEKTWQLSTTEQLPKPNIDRAWQNVLSRVEVEKTTKQIEFQKNDFSFIRYAAAIVVFVSAAAIWLLLQSDSWFKWTNNQLSTKENEKKSIVLSDGSKVMLNGGSTLYYPTTFSASKREVMLEGEAFFEVEHNSEQPFVIEAGDTETKVLGTQFNLRYYPSEAKTEVFLKEGKVSFNANQENVLLLPGEIATFNETSKKVEKEKNQNNNIISWQTGKLQFRETPLKEVVNTLARYYRKEIVVPEKSKLACDYTGSFDQITLYEALQLMQYSADFIYKEENNKVIISGTMCPN